MGNSVNDALSPRSWWPTAVAIQQWMSSLLGNSVRLLMQSFLVDQVHQVKSLAEVFCPRDVTASDLVQGCRGSGAPRRPRTAERTVHTGRKPASRQANSCRTLNDISAAINFDILNQDAHRRKLVAQLSINLTRSMISLIRAPTD